MLICGFRPSVRSIISAVFIVMMVSMLGVETCFFFSFNSYCCHAVIATIVINLIFVIRSCYLLHVKISNKGWVETKEQAPLLLDQNSSREKMRTWFYRATENLFWKSKEVYFYCGLYAIITYLIDVLFISKQPCFFDYNQVVLWWGGLFISYPLYASWISKDDKRIVSIWFFGLISLLFIIGPMNFIMQGYALEYGIILFVNLIVANILWPLSLVMTLMIIGVLGTSLLCSPLNPDITIWSVWIQTIPRVTLWCSVGTITLLSYIRYKKMVSIYTLKEKNITKLQDAKEWTEVHRLQFCQRLDYLMTRGRFSRLDDMLPDLNLLFGEYQSCMNAEDMEDYFDNLKQISEIPFLLQAYYYYSQEFLPLTMSTIDLPFLVKEVTNIHRVLNSRNSLLITSDIPNIALCGDKHQLKQLLLGGIQYLQSKSVDKIIQLYFGMTKLQYEFTTMPNTDPIQELPALAVCITNHHEKIANIEPCYQGNLGRPTLSVPKVAADLLKRNNERIIDANYGYVCNSETDTGFILRYVIPLDIGQIRHKIMNQLVPISSTSYLKTAYSVALELELRKSLKEKNIFANFNIGDVLSFVKRCHGHATRRYTKEPLYTFSLSMALLLLEMTQKPSLLLTALLHGITEVTNIPISYIRCKFGYQVAYLFTKLNHLTQDFKKVEYTHLSQYSHLRIEDSSIEVAQLKLAKRLINLRSDIPYESKEIQLMLAQETLSHYVPFAKAMKKMSFVQEIISICESLMNDNIMCKKN